MLRRRGATFLEGAFLGRGLAALTGRRAGRFADFLLFFVARFIAFAMIVSVAMLPDLLILSQFCNQMVCFD
jgi:hypothetical protein